MTLDEQLEAVTAERDYWREEAQRNATMDVVDRIRRAFELTTGEAWILANLHRAHGRVVRTERLDEDRPGKPWDEREPGGNTLQVLICHLRTKVGRDAIVTARGFGYRLSPAMVARIDQVLAS